MMVATAATVAEALTFFKSRDFDLVVTNLLGRGTGTTMSKEMMSLMPAVRSKALNCRIRILTSVITPFIQSGRACKTPRYVVEATTSDAPLIAQTQPSDRWLS